MSADGFVGVEVPASSANLGPGFDAFAAAIDLRLTVWTVERRRKRVRPEGEGAEDLPTGDDNMIWKGMLAYCQHFGAEVPDVSLRALSDIPLERGLGSSAAAAVAGVSLGRAATRAGGSDQDLIDIATKLEGHPDNVAAAVLGGMVVCYDGHARRLDPSERLRPVLCIPPSRQSTDEARRILPWTVPLAQAAANGARAAVVLAGLVGAMPWDPTAMTDVLHEPKRFKVMPKTGKIVAALRGAGIAACLSGAGPSVLAIARAADETAVSLIRTHVPDDWTVHPARWDRAGAVIAPPSVVPGDDDDDAGR
ncbi:MAG TPA: homoserine kinase [Egibacteraceae bacterium]|nr:homoserine kinase [Egibacteraceae bacterium]